MVCEVGVSEALGCEVGVPLGIPVHPDKTAITVIDKKAIRVFLNLCHLSN
jgi:hypothetical protein